MDPYAISFRKRQEAPAPPTKPQSDMDKDALMSEVSSSEGEVARWLSPYGANPDPVARQKGLKLYEDMMADDQVAVCVGIRKKALLTVDWSIEPGEPGNARSEMYAEFIEHVLERMDGTLENDLEDICSAIEFGFSISELNFELLEGGDFNGKIGLRSIKTREPYNYHFKVDGHGNILGLVYVGITPPPSRPGEPLIAGTRGTGPLWTMPGRALVSPIDAALGSYENPFPMEKFIHYAYHPKFNNPYGRSDLLPAFRYWNAKRYVLKFWNIWLERYATPFMHATIDGALVSNKKKIMDDVDDFIKNLQARSGFRSPKGVELEVKGGTSRTGADSYENAVEAFNRWISHGLFTPNLMGFAGSGAGGGSGSSGGQTGSFALGKKQFEAFMWVLQKQTKDIEEELMGDQVIRRLMELNFPEQNEKLFPKFRMSDTDDEQTKMRGEILDILSRQGFVDPSEEWVREWLSLPEVAPGIVLARPMPASPWGQLGGEARSGQQPGKRQLEKNGKSKPGEKKNKARKNEADVTVREFIDERPSYESKVDFKELESSLDSAEERFARDLNSAMVDSIGEFMKTLEKRGLLSPAADAADVARLTFNVGAIDDTIEMWLVKLHLDSKLRALEELRKGGVPIEIVRKFDDTPNEAWEPLPPEDAIDFFNKKVLARITTSGGEKVLVVLATGGELEYYSDKAFAVAGIVRDDILNEAKQIILNGIKRLDVEATKEGLKELFSKYVAEGTIGAEVAAPARLATIVRTNTLDALNQGRRDLFEDPDVEGFVSYWEYSSVIDERTTDYCRCMDGKLFAMDDIGLLTPPSHYNCRAISVPVTKYETKGKEITISSPCQDREASFADIVRDLAPVMPGLHDAPTLAIQPEPLPKLDDPPAPKSSATLEAERKLREELSQMIVMCAYSPCRSQNIRFVRRMLNVGEFACDDCHLPFRVSNMGDVYLFDPGIEKWERATRGLVPGFFSEKGVEAINKRNGADG